MCTIIKERKRSIDEDLEIERLRDEELKRQGEESIRQRKKQMLDPEYQKFHKKLIYCMEKEIKAMEERINKVLLEPQ